MSCIAPQDGALHAASLRDSALHNRTYSSSYATEIANLPGIANEFGADEMEAASAPQADNSGYRFQFSP